MGLHSTSTARNITVNQNLRPYLYQKKFAVTLGLSLGKDAMATSEIALEVNFLTILQICNVVVVFTSCLF